MSSKISDAKRKKLKGLVSEYSIKFYDGTYQMVEDGYTDEKGVYQAWADPHTRAPTPMPHLDSDSNEGDYNMHSDPSDEQRGGHGNRTGARSPPDNINNRSGEDTEQTQLSRVFVQSVKGSGSENVSVLMTLNGVEREIALPQAHLFREHEHSERLLGRLEGILLGHRLSEAGLDLERCYRSCRMLSPNGTLLTGPRSDPSTLPDVSSQPSSEDASRVLRGTSDGLVPNVQDVVAAQVPSTGTPQQAVTASAEWDDESTISTLSRCPSDLSDWTFSDSERDRIWQQSPEANRTPENARDEAVETATHQEPSAEINETPGNDDTGPVETTKPAARKRAGKAGKEKKDVARRRSARQASQLGKTT